MRGGNQASATPAHNAVNPMDRERFRISAFGSIGVSIFILALLAFGVLWTAFTKDSQLFGNLMETVKAAVMAVIGYWIRGSSAPSSTSQNPTQAHDLRVATTGPGNTTVQATTADSGTPVTDTPAASGDARAVDQAADPAPRPPGT